MVETALHKSSKIPDNKLGLRRVQSWPSETRGPLGVSVHPRTRDILLCPLEVEVVCHYANRHKVRDEGFDVVERQSFGVEQELVTCLPNPFSQNLEPFRQIRRITEIECGDRAKLWRRGVQNRVDNTDPISIRTKSGSVAVAVSSITHVKMPL
jgi:hypothetical protein